MGGCCSKDDTKKLKEGEEGSQNQSGSRADKSSKASSASNAQDASSYPSERGQARAAADPEDSLTPSRDAPAGTAAAVVAPTPNGREDLFTRSQDDRMGIHPGLDKYANLTASEMSSDEGKSWHSLDSMSSADLHTLRSQSSQATGVTGLTGRSKGKAKSHVTFADDEPTDMTEVQSSAFLSPVDDDTRSMVSAVSAFSNAPHGYDYYAKDIPATSSLARRGGDAATPPLATSPQDGQSARGGGGFTVTDVRKNQRADFQRTGSARSGLSRGHEPYGHNVDDADDDVASFYSCNTMATNATAAAAAVADKSQQQQQQQHAPPPRNANRSSPATSARREETYPAAEDDVGSSQFQSLPPTEMYSTVDPQSSRRPPAAASAKATSSSWAAPQPASARGIRPTSSRGKSAVSATPTTTSTTASGTGQRASARSAASSARAPSARSAAKRTPASVQTSSGRTPSARSKTDEDRSERAVELAEGDPDAPAPASRPTMRPDQLVSAPPPDMDESDLYEDAVSEAMTFRTAISYGTAYTEFNTAANAPVPGVASASAPRSAVPPAQAQTPARASSSSSEAALPADASSARQYPTESELTYRTARSAGIDTAAASTYLPDPPGLKEDVSTRDPSRAASLVNPAALKPEEMYEDAQDNDDAMSDMTFLTARSAGGATTITEANVTNNKNTPRKSSIVVLSGLTKPPTAPATSSAPSAPAPTAAPAAAAAAADAPAPAPVEPEEPLRPSVIKRRPERPSAIRRRSAAELKKARPAQLTSTAAVATRSPVVLGVGSTALHTQSRPSTAASDGARHRTGAAATHISTSFAESGDADSGASVHTPPGTPSSSRERGRTSRSGPPTRRGNTSGELGGRGPLAAVRALAAMRVASPCLYLTPSPSHVTSGLFYGGDGRVSGETLGLLASHVMDSVPASSAATPTSSSPMHRHGTAGQPTMTTPVELPAAPARLTGRASVLGSRSRGAPYWRSRQYESFPYLLQQYMERGFGDAEALLTHPDAPSPAELLEQILPHRLPSALLMERALGAIVVSATFGRGGVSSELADAGAAARALERVTAVLRTNASASLLYHNPTLRVALLEALLASKLTQQAAAVAEDTPTEWLTPRVWHRLIDAAAQGQMANSTLLWRWLVEAPEAHAAASASLEALSNSVAPHTSSRHTVQLPASEFAYAAAHYVPSSTAAGNVALADRAASAATAGRIRLFHDLNEFQSFAEPLFAQHASATATAASSPPPRPDGASRTRGRAWTEKEKKWLGMSFVLHARGVVYGLDAKLTAALLLRAGPAMRQQAGSLLALHILRRYVRTCELLATEANALEASLTAQIMGMRDWNRTRQTQSQPIAAATATTATAAASSTADAMLVPVLFPTATAAALPLSLSSSVPAVLFHTDPHTAPSLASAAMPHPSPYLAFFRIAREARDLMTLVVEEDAAEAAVASTTSNSNSSRTGTTTASAGRPSLAVSKLVRRRTALPMMHWELVWHAFQQLNRYNPRWYTQMPPEEAADLCQDVVEVLCRGADPWLTLNVARAVSSRHIIDGLDMTLWLLHHLDASHHTQEAKEVTRKLYQWLLVDVGIHLHPALHHHLIPAARVLIRLGLHDDLKSFYNAVLDNVYAFSETFRHDFMTVMADLACPACSALLADHDAYHDRTCPNCMQHIPAKSPDTLPSYQLSAEHVARQRERRLTQQRNRRQRTFQSAHRLGGMRQSVQDAAVALFNKEVLMSPTSDAGRGRAPLLPGVALASSLPLFPLEDGGDAQRGHNTGNPDLRTALEESYRRLDLQRQARAYALSHRGLAPESAAMPSSAYEVLHRLNQQQTPSYDRYGGSHAALLASSGGDAVPMGTMDGPWVCVWCQEKNSEWASRLECTACGAETGPAAPWRTFSYAQDGDAMAEIRARIANCDERPVEAVMAAYLLLVYRRTFLLRAAPHDHERIRHLVHRLCELQERVLAGYTYTRLVPPPQRRKDENVLLLTQLFDGSLEGCQALTETDLADDEKLFNVIFSKGTCRVCFGHHEWKRCPIITRDFSATAASSSSSSADPSTSGARISLSPEEKQALVLKQIKKLISIAVAQGREKPKLVVDAYAAFITSPFREVFAEVHNEEANALSITLSRFKQFRRAAFVLCHVPPYARQNAAYLAFAHYFNVAEEDALQMLSRRSPLGLQDNTHPNFVQVTRTCCMCLDERHASFECPRLVTWLREARQLSSLSAPSGSSRGRGSGATTALVDPMLEYNLQRRLKAQVDGWTTAGPERLYAFYRFLLGHVEELRDTETSVDTFAEGGASRPRSRPPRRDGAALFENALVYAVNKVTRKLASAGQDKEAYRLYAHTPGACLAVATTTALLRLQGFSDTHIRDLLYATETEEDGAGEEARKAAGPSALPSLESTTTATTSAAARSAAVPLRQRCLLCFDLSHSFMQCPELAARGSLAERLEHVVRDVGGIVCSTDGISGAAAFVYHMYNMGQLPHDLLRDHPSAVRALLTLSHRAFASGHVAAGVRVLRRLPIEMVPPLPIYAALWRAAGLPESVVESRQSALLALYDSENIRPSLDAPPPRPTFSTHFMSSLGKLIHDDLCRHCYQSGHTLATCHVFHAEVSFGRDYVAAYRMNMMSEQLSTEWQDDYLLTLVRFFDTHRLFMPYHIAGVANALSAIAAMWSFRGEPGIALRHLLLIPPAYRRRQAFKHLLHCLQVPAADISRLLDGIVFIPDDVGSRSAPASSTSVTTSGSGSAGGNGGGASVAHHLLIPKPAIRDVALKAVFEKVPAAMAALDESETRMSVIVTRNAPPSTTSSSSSSSPSSAGVEVGSGSTASTPPHAVPLSQKWGEVILPARLVMQSGDIQRLREDFDPILSRLEEAVGMKLGSRHILFTSAVNVLGANAPTAATAPNPDEAVQKEESHKGNSHSARDASRGETHTTTAAASSTTPRAEARHTETAAKTRTQRPSESQSSQRSRSAPARRYVGDDEVRTEVSAPSSSSSRQGKHGGRHNSGYHRRTSREARPAQTRRNGNTLSSLEDNPRRDNSKPRGRSNYRRTD